MSNIDRIGASVSLEDELIRAIEAVHFCTRAEIFVFGIHSASAEDRGDYQKFNEIMNLIGCWNHQLEVRRRKLRTFGTGNEYEIIL